MAVARRARLVRPAVTDYWAWADLLAELCNLDSVRDLAPAEARRLGDRYLDLLGMGGLAVKAARYQALERLHMAAHGYILELLDYSRLVLSPEVTGRVPVLRLEGGRVVTELTDNDHTPLGDDFDGWVAVNRVVESRQLFPWRRCDAPVVRGRGAADRCRRVYVRNRRRRFCSPACKKRKAREEGRNG